MASHTQSARGLQPYPSYKPSGVEWLGDVPAHWKVRRLGHLLYERKEMNENGQVTKVLSLLRNRGVIPYEEKGNIGNKKSEDITRYKVVRPDDIVVNSMNVIIGSVGISSYKGCLSPVYYVLTRRSKHDHPQYLNAYFQTKPFQESLVRIGNGILSHRMRIPMELLKCELFPHPPPVEQAAIARYLDRADERIRRSIEAKEKLVGLLEEMRQALINEAVTGRFDVRTGKPYPAYKPSGVEWLGDVPAHWEVRRLKNWLRINEVVLSEDTNPNYTFDYVDIGAVGTGFLTAELARISFRSAPSRARRVLQSGDTIVSTVRTYLKAVWSPKEPVEKLIASTGFAVLTPPHGTASRFVGYLCQSDYFADCVTSESVGIAYPAISETKLGALEVCVPPLSEQAAIARYLDRADERIQRSIQSARRQIDLLNEYRTRLIADVVTGKLDVRQAAAELPGDTEEPESVD